MNKKKKQHDAVLVELKHSLALYQSIFEQQLLDYRDLVHQASSLLAQSNNTSPIPIEQVRPILDKLHRGIAASERDRIIIKCEPVFNLMENDHSSNESKSMNDTQITTDDEDKYMDVNHTVIVRLDRIDYPDSFEKENALQGKDQNNDQYQDDDNPVYLKSIAVDPGSIFDSTNKSDGGMRVGLRSRKSTNDVYKHQQQHQQQKKTFSSIDIAYFFNKEKT